MVLDPDLMRMLLFVLEGRQQSPRATIFISIDDEARDLLYDPSALAASLQALLDLGYIDGPGQDESGFWMFRKITRKGVQFIRATREPRDWATMKARFESQKVTKRA